MWWVCCVGHSLFQIILCPLRLHLPLNAKPSVGAVSKLCGPWMKYQPFVRLSFNVNPRCPSQKFPSCVLLCASFSFPFGFSGQIAQHYKIFLELASGMEHWESSHIQIKSHKLVLLIEHHFNFMGTKLSNFGSLDFLFNIPWLCVTPTLHAHQLCITFWSYFTT